MHSSCNEMFAPNVFWKNYIPFLCLLVKLNWIPFIVIVFRRKNKFQTIFSFKNLLFERGKNLFCDFHLHNCFLLRFISRSHKIFIAVNFLHVFKWFKEMKCINLFQKSCEIFLFTLFLFLPFDHWSIGGRFVSHPKSTNAY